MIPRVLQREPWMAWGPCAETDPDLFFPAENTHPTEAVAICRSCEFRVRCLGYALDHAEAGVWGGFTESGRREVMRQRKAGRSLADIIAEDDAVYLAWIEAAPERAAAKMARQRERQQARAAGARQALTGTVPQPGGQEAA